MDDACSVWVVYCRCYVDENKKKDLVHDVLSSHNDVHLWIVYQIKKKKKMTKKINKNFNL